MGSYFYITLVTSKGPLMENQSAIRLSPGNGHYKFLTQKDILLTDMPSENEDEESVNGDEDPNFQPNLTTEYVPVS
jgi:hypothetical protein